MQYRIVTTLQFDRLWQSAVDVGVLHPEVDEIHLQRLVRFLSLDPRSFLFDPGGGPANWGRALLIAGPTAVEVLYEVVEDDGTVYLQSLEFG